MIYTCNVRVYGGQINYNQQYYTVRVKGGVDELMAMSGYKYYVQRIQ